MKSDGIRIGPDVIGLALAAGIAAGLGATALAGGERPPADIAVLRFLLIALPAGALAGWIRAVTKA